MEAVDLVRTILETTIIKSYTQLIKEIYFEHYTMMGPIFVVYTITKVR